MNHPSHLTSPSRLARDSPESPARQDVSAVRLRLGSGSSRKVSRRAAAKPELRPSWMLLGLNESILSTCTTGVFAAIGHVRWVAAARWPDFRPCQMWVNPFRYRVDACRASTTVVMRPVSRSYTWPETLIVGGSNGEESRRSTSTETVVCGSGTAEASRVFS